MAEPFSRASSRRQLRRYVAAAVLAGMAAAGGYLLMAVPNVEIFTLLIFLAGYLLGVKLGLAAALCAALLYFGLNPQGGVFPPLLIAQVAGVSIAPVLGALMARLKLSGAMLRVSLAVSALLATFWYDLLTNIAFPLATGMGFKGTLMMLAAGIPFSLLHIGGNVLIFVLIVPIILPIASRRLGV